VTKRPRRRPREYLIRQKTDYEAALARRSIELIRDGLPPEHSPDRLAGFTLGKLLLRHRESPHSPGSINERQFYAGCEWATVVHRYAHIMGFRVTIPSPAFDMVGRGGISLADDPSEAEAVEVKSKFRECFAATQGSPILWGICVENWPVGTLAAEDYGALREGLNALDRVLCRH
jgi:hypothetical protein